MRMTGGELGRRLGITPQQISKIERGVSSLNAGQLWRVSEVLSRPIDWFFDGSAVPESSVGVRKGREFYEAIERLDDDRLHLLIALSRQLISVEDGHAMMTFDH